MLGILDLTGGVDGTYSQWQRIAMHINTEIFKPNDRPMKITITCVVGRARLEATSTNGRLNNYLSCDCSNTFVGTPRRIIAKNSRARESEESRRMIPMRQHGPS